MKTFALRAGLLAALLSFAAVPGAATVCKYNDLKHAQLTHELRVNARGWDCDFKDIGSALSWITTNTSSRSVTSMWSVKVAGGAYTETSITVPSYTVVEGDPDLDTPSTTHLGQPKLSISGDTGSLITMGDKSAWDGIAVFPTAAELAGAVKVFDTTGVTATISETLISVGSGVGDEENLYGVYNGAAGVLTLSEVNFLAAGTRTKTWGVLNLGESMDIWGGHWAGSASMLKMVQNNISGKTLRLTGVQLDALAGGVDLTNTAGTLAVYSTPYATSSGTITHPDLRAAKLYIAACTPASATATCTAGQVCLDASYVYFCSATNTWTRGALSTWP